MSTLAKVNGWTVARSRADGVAEARTEGDVVGPSDRLACKWEGKP